MFFLAEKQQQTILNSILNILSDYKFVTRKQDIFNDQSNTNYVENQTIYTTETLKSCLCDYNDAYILVKNDITVTTAPETHVSFKNCAPFTRFRFSLPIVQSNYPQTTGSLWFYSKDKATNFDGDIANNNNFRSFKFKAKLLGNTKAQPNPNQANGILKNAAMAVPSKYLPNFWRSLEMPLIIWKVELKSKWTKYCILSAANNDNLTNNNASYIIFTIKGTKSYVPFVNVSARDNQKLSNFLGKGFKRTIFWKEYKIKSEN